MVVSQPLKLYSARSVIGSPYGGGRKLFIWLAQRSAPVADYRFVIENYSSGSSSARQKELALDQLFTESEVQQLGEYLRSHYDIEIQTREFQLPGRFDYPVPLAAKGPGIAFEDWDLPTGEPLTFYLYQQEGYHLSVPILAVVLFDRIPKLPVEQSRVMSNLFLSSELRRLVGAELQLAEDPDDEPDGLATLFQNIYHGEVDSIEIDEAIELPPTPAWENTFPIKPFRNSSSAALESNSPGRANFHSMLETAIHKNEPPASHSSHEIYEKHLGWKTARSESLQRRLLSLLSAPLQRLSVTCQNAYLRGKSTPEQATAYQLTNIHQVFQSAANRGVEVYVAVALVEGLELAENSPNDPRPAPQHFEPTSDRSRMLAYYDVVPLFQRAVEGLFYTFLGENPSFANQPFRDVDRFKSALLCTAVDAYLLCLAHT